MVKPSAFKIRWDRKALDQLKEILEYLTKQSEQAPKIVKSAIISRLDTLKTNPLITEPDKLKEPPDNDFRSFIVFSYRVSYQIKADLREIRILRIRHTSREPLGY
jgi:plasmid stabilization system protein ParE